MSENIKIKISKFYQTQDNTPCIKINPYDPSNKDRYPKSVFLSLHLNKTEPFKISTEKPGAFAPSSQFALLCRKHIGSGRLLSVKEISISSHTFPPLSSGSCHDEESKNQNEAPPRYKGLVFTIGSGEKRIFGRHCIEH